MLMKAASITLLGANRSLELKNVPVPVPAPHEVLIKVAFAGINRADLFQVQGSYREPNGASPIPGLEVSGTIYACGSLVKGWKVGDQAAALVAGGGYAEYVTASASLLFSVPLGLTMLEAAALPEALFTAYLNLFFLGKLKAKDSLLIHAGASGIGHIAIQMAKTSDIQVFTTASSAEKCDFCLKLGADFAFNYQGDWTKQLLEATEGKGVTAILDMFGGQFLASNLEILKEGGKLMLIACLKGSKAEASLGKILLKNLTIKGSTLRSQTLATKIQLAKRIRQIFWPKVEEGLIRPVIAQSFSFAEVNNSHEYMSSNQNMGKIVLEI
jgi:putative PIG3 family NAD(P)H quinone oxidoreductase